MLNKAYNTILLCQFDKVDVVREQLSRRLRDQDMQFPLESVFRDGVVGAYQASQPRDDTYAQRSGRTVGREDDDRLSGLHFFHRNLVFRGIKTVRPLFGGKLTSFWIRLVDLRVVVEATYQSAITQGLWSKSNAREVHVLVHFADVLREMFTNGREFATANAGHPELVHLTEPPQIEACEADDLDILSASQSSRDYAHTPIYSVLH